MTLRIGSLCSGYEGLGMAVQSVLGGELAWVADNDPGAAAILAHRFPATPNLGDITSVDWSAVSPVDIFCAGFPCTDVSCAGARAGLREGTRSGVWAWCAAAIAALRPSLVFIENVRGLLSAGADSNMEPCPWCLGDGGDEHPLRASGAVLGDLADLGFDAEWATVPASAVGAPHRRERVFIAAWPAADAGSERRNGWPGLGGARWPAPVGEQASYHGGNSPLAPAQDPYGATGGEWRQPAPGQAPGGWPRADAGGSGGTRTAADADSPAGRRHEPGSGPSPLQGAAIAEWPAQQPGRLHSSSEDSGSVAWGAYEPAIRRWESVLGRPAPRPTEPGRTGERLSRRFVEWMQGLPEGWVTDVPGLSRNAQLKALGNGVVPQQAARALRLLLPSAATAENGAQDGEAA